MATQKFNDPFSFMPAGLIDPKLDEKLLIASEDAREHGQKTIRIALGLFDHAMSALHGIHPAEDIEPLLMLASGPNRRLGPLFHPHPPQFGMQTKTGFIGKQQNPITAFVFSPHPAF
jgi:hypothetical protein